MAVGSPSANLTRGETEGLIGLLVNTLVLRTSFAAEVSFRELLRQVREITLGAYAHQDLPFEKLVEELQPERNLSHHPLFQVMFALQQSVQNRQNGDLGGVGEAPGLMTGTAKFDLTLIVTESGEGLL